MKLFEQDFYVDRDSMRDAVRRRGMCNLIHTATVVKVDFVIRKASAYRREEFARRWRASIGAHEAFIVAPEDLVLSKLEWAKDSRSELQLNDVRNLLRNGPELDMTYLTRWALELGVDGLLAEVSRIRKPGEARLPKTLTERNVHTSAIGVLSAFAAETC